jgi:hypothetical protein
VSGGLVEGIWRCFFSFFWFVGVVELVVVMGEVVGVLQFSLFAYGTLPALTVRRALLRDSEVEIYICKCD